MTQSNYNPTGAGTNGGVEVNAAFVAPFDRIRWGPVLAGLFTAMSTLALLSVLGLAIGFSAYDSGDNVRRFSMAAGIWSIVSALIAFFIGGYLAARSAAVAGERNGLLNGSMVWAVAIPLLIYLVGGGMASMADTVINGANQTRVVYMDGSGDATDRAQPASGQIGAGGDSVAQSPANATGNLPTSDEAARDAAKGAWWTLLSLVLGLAAAAAGGLAGARSFDDGHRRHDRGTNVGNYGTTGTTGT